MEWAGAGGRRIRIPGGPALRRRQKGRRPRPALLNHESRITDPPPPALRRGQLRHYAHPDVVPQFAHL